MAVLRAVVVLFSRNQLPAHTPQGDMRIRDIIARMRHDGGGGRAGRVELLTGIEGASSRPVRRIVLIGD
jgi:hypothetical protein